MVGPVAGHSEKQVEWLGRIEYYGGREMWRKAEEKFQQVRGVAWCHVAWRACVRECVRASVGRCRVPRSWRTMGGGKWKLSFRLSICLLNMEAIFYISEGDTYKT